jgi:hypothetical protein
MRADDLMAAVFPRSGSVRRNLTAMVFPDHPLVKETIDNRPYEAMDLKASRKCPAHPEGGFDGRDRHRKRRHFTDAHRELYAYLDDAPLEERRQARAVQLRRNPAHRRDGWRSPRSGSDPHGCERGGRWCATLTSCTALLGCDPRARNGRRSLRICQAARRERNGWYWIAAERPDLRRACPDARFTPDIEAPPPRALPNREKPAWRKPAGWAERVAAARFRTGGDLALPQDMVEIALAQLEAEGQILWGIFAPRRGEMSGRIGGCWRAYTGWTIGHLCVRLSRSPWRLQICRRAGAPGDRHATHGFDGALQDPQLQGLELPRPRGRARCRRAASPATIPAAG